MLRTKIEISENALMRLKCDISVFFSQKKCSRDINGNDGNGCFACNKQQKQRFSNRSWKTRARVRICVHFMSCLTRTKDLLKKCISICINFKDVCNVWVYGMHAVDDYVM